MLRPALIAVLLPFAAQAAGTEPAKPTQTSTDCTGAQVYDEDSKTCVDPKDARLDDDIRLEAARELASFGRPGDALSVLAALARPETSDALTVRGYATRKAGDFDGGVALYKAALAIDPDNWLARSYLGQGLAERGDRDGALAQLTAIRTSGGRGSYPERSLVEALGGGGFDY